MRAHWVILLCMVCLIIGCVAGFFAGLFVNIARVGRAFTPESVAVSVNAPATVKVGETFTLTVTITDLSGAARRVHDIDIAETLLEGLTITGISPTPASTSSMKGYAVYTMNAPVPASGQTVVTFTLKADAAGTFVGDVDTYVDSDLAFSTNTVAVNVTP